VEQSNMYDKLITGKSRHSRIRYFKKTLVWKWWDELYVWTIRI